MDTAIVVALIAAAASVFAAILTFFLTKNKEREVEWRKVRIEQYKELVAAMSDAVGTNLPAAARKRLAVAANHVGLFASPDVLRHLTRLLTAVASGNNPNHDEILTDLMHAIRTDLAIPGAESQEGIQFRLWGAGGQGNAP
jgi:hypothetical protein